MKYISKFNQTALHIALKKGNLEIAKLLLTKEGIDINAIYVYNIIIWYNFNIMISLYLR